MNEKQDEQLPVPPSEVKKVRRVGIDQVGRKVETEEMRQQLVEDLTRGGVSKETALGFLQDLDEYNGSVADFAHETAQTLAGFIQEGDNRGRRKDQSLQEWREEVEKTVKAELKETLGIWIETAGKGLNLENSEVSYTELGYILVRKPKFDENKLRRELKERRTSWGNPYEAFIEETVNKAAEFWRNEGQKIWDKAVKKKLASRRWDKNLGDWSQTSLDLKTKRKQ